MWWVQLKGKESDLNRIQEIFSDEKDDFQIIQKEEGDRKSFYLKFELETTDADKVVSRAQEIASQINGAIKLKFDRVSPIEVPGDTYVRDVTNKISTSGTTHIMIVKDNLHIMDRVKETVKDSDGNIIKVSPDEEIKKLVQIGLINPKIRKVLDLTSNLEDWVNLYRIFEIIQQDVDGTDFITQSGWSSKNKITLFKRTANSPKSIGKKARHGTESTKPPKNPMKLSEAKEIIRKIIQDWIQHKNS